MIKDFTLEDAMAILRMEYDLSFTIEHEEELENGYVFELTSKEGNRFSVSIDKKNKFPIVVPVS